MSLPIHDLVTRRPQLQQSLVADLCIQRGRVHEFCGPSRIALAAMVMAKSAGPVIWVHPGWVSERLNPAGLQPYADPGRLIMVRADREDKLLWAAEEALRSGAAPLVVADLVTPPALTPVRRLHLAAEAGAEMARKSGGLAPLGVLLLPDTGGAQGVESRWHIAAAPSRTLLSDTADSWNLARLRARLLPPAKWRLTRIEPGREALEMQEADDRNTTS